VHEEDVLLQQEYQMAISKSQQAFIKSKLEAIRKREQQIITKVRELEDREKALSEHEKWVADKKIIVNTAQKTLKDLKNQFLKERWEYEANVIKSEKDVLKRKRDNFVTQVKSMQDAIDLEEDGIERKQVMLDAKLKKIADEGKLNRDKDKPKDEIEGTTDQEKKI
jgi:protein gp37